MRPLVITLALVLAIWIIIVAASHSPRQVVAGETLFQEESPDEVTLDDGAAGLSIDPEPTLLVVKLEINVLVISSLKSEGEAPMAA